MNRSLFLIIFAAYSLIVSSQNKVNIIPQPVDITLGCCKYSLGSHFKLRGNIDKNEKQFFEQYIKAELALRDIKKEKGDIRVIDINIDANNTLLTQRDSYVINNTDGKKITVICNTIEAAFYAIQTLLQMVDNEANIQNCTVTDYPRFQYRGIMIDCSRHFWSKELILKQIDAMARYKLNYLHLHLTDAGGWRFESKTYPELTQKGSFRTESDWNNWWVSGTDRQYADVSAEDYLNNRAYYEQPDSRPYGGYYTQDELKEIVDYAAKRYITIIPEIEMPGHSEEVIAALPYLACEDNTQNSGAFCIGNEQTFAFLETILTEVMGIFPSEYIHIGGDETSREHWEKCKKCRQRMTDEHLATTAELQSYLTERIERFLNNHGRKLLGWDEILEGKLAPNATVMSWRGTSGGLKAAEDNHHVIMSPGGYCYLDAYQDAPYCQPRAFGGYTPLNRTYSYEPIPTEIKSTDKEQYINGLQGNLWTEMIDTPEHLEYMLWPRALAIAEIGWSQQHDNYPDFHQRAIKIVNDMHQMGYNAFPLDKEIGERQDAFITIDHEGIGKPVTYLAPYADVYAASGDGSLTDGLSGKWSYGDGRWQGFITKGGFDVIIDMLQPTDIRDISINFMQFSGPEIFAPQSIDIKASLDGTNFDDLYYRSYDVSRDCDYFIRNETWVGKISARYIKIKASSGKYGGWIFTDEVFINTKEEQPANN